jgi:malate:Na+ symporter
VLGLGAHNTFFFIVAPIMGGGVGEGAIPLSIGYSGITGIPQGQVLARVLPAVLVGNLTAIILSGVLNYAGKRYPNLTGEGRLQPGGEDDLVAALDGARPDGNVQNIAAAAMIAVTLYLAGVLAFQFLGFPAPVVMLFLAVVLKLAHAISPRLEAGSYTVYKFCLTAVAFPMLFAFGVVLTPWDKLIAGFAPANLLTIVATVSSLVVTGFFAARLVNLYPVESAIVTATHSGMGGAGDIAILTASDRMRLMPFAQIATRIGGGITVTLALILMAYLSH